MSANDRFARWLQRRRRVVLAFAAVVAVAGIAAGMHMPVRSELSSLLPESNRSVRDLHVLQQRARSFGNVLVMVDAKTPMLRVRAVERALERFKRISNELVAGVIADDSALAQWTWRNRFMLPELSDLERARDALARRIVDARLQANPFYVELEDPGRPDRSLVAEWVQRLADLEAATHRPSSRISRDGAAQLIEIKATFASSNIVRGRELVERIHEALGDVEREVPGTHCYLAGTINISIHEHDSVVDGMALAAGLTLLLCGLGLLAFYRSLFAIGALVVSLAVGVAATLGFAWLAVGYLDVMSAFLTAIVIGNGINPGLVLLARYCEELERGRPPSDAIGIAIRGTARGTLAATLTASVAYVALVVTDFRGFRNFGIIGGAGMLLCWITAFTVLPAALFELAGRGRHARHRTTLLGIWLGKLSTTRPGRVVILGIAVSAIAGGITATYLRDDPFSDDWRDLQSNSAKIAAQREVDALMRDRFDGGLLGGQSYRLAFAVSRRNDAAPLVRTLRDAVDRDGAPIFAKVHFFDELVPRDQSSKLAVLAEIRAMLDDRIVDELGLSRLRPPDDLAPVTESEVPPELAWPFVEQDGRVGRLVFAWGASRFRTWDVGDRREFADAVYDLRLPADTAIGGEALVIADIVATMKRDAPWMILASLAGSILAVWLLVGMRRHGVVTLVCGMAGVVVMIATCALVGIRVHFIDLIALPITIGIGIDYAVNLAARDRAEGGDSRRLLETTGAAVALCSYTTAVGYGSLLLSPNGGIRAFGLAALIGELACVILALVLAPALLALLRR